MVALRVYHMRAVEGSPFSLLPCDNKGCAVHCKTKIDKNLHNQYCWIEDMLSEAINVFLRLPVSQGEVAHDGFFVAANHVQMSIIPSCCFYNC